MKLKLLYSILALFIYTTAFANAKPVKDSIPNGDVLGTLSGTITDKADGKPIPGATVAIPDLRTGAVSDANGKYLISQLPKGIYLVQVSFIGYATFNQRVDLTKTSVLNVQLQTSSIEAGEVIITGVS